MIEGKYSMVSIKTSVLSSILVGAFTQKSILNNPGLSQVLRAPVHENQGNLDIFEKVSTKQPVLSQFQILEDQVHRVHRLAILNSSNFVSSIMI